MSNNLNNQFEAESRVHEAASILASAIRLGAEGGDARLAMDEAIKEGAKQLMQDTIEAWGMRR